MSRLLALALVVGLASAVPAAVKVGIANVHGGHSPHFGPVNFGSPTPFGSPTLSLTFGAAGSPGGSLSRGFSTSFGSPSLGLASGAAGFAGGSINQSSPPFGPGVFFPNFGGCMFANGPCNFGCPIPGGPGFCGPCVGGFGCAPGCNWAGRSLNRFRFSRDLSIYYGPWYDEGYGWNEPWGMSNYGYGYASLPISGELFSTSNDYGYYQPAPPRPQVIHFPAPLAAGTAQVKIVIPHDAQVTVQGQSVPGKDSERTFVTPVLNGPTTFDFKVSQQVNGKQVEQSHKLTVTPGDRKQLMIIQ